MRKKKTIPSIKLHPSKSFGPGSFDSGSHGIYFLEMLNKILSEFQKFYFSNSRSSAMPPLRESGKQLFGFFFRYEIVIGDGWKLHCIGCLIRPNFRDFVRISIYLIPPKVLLSNFRGRSSQLHSMEMIKQPWIQSFTIILHHFISQFLLPQWKNQTSIFEISRIGIGSLEIQILQCWFLTIDDWRY